MNGYLMGIAAGLFILYMVFLGLTILDLRSRAYNDNTVIDLAKDLIPGVCYQFCTASIAGKDLWCDEKNYFVSFYNKTSDEILKAIKACPNGKIMKENICIGDRINYCP